MLIPYVPAAARRPRPAISRVLGAAFTSLALLALPAAPAGAAANPHVAFLRALFRSQTVDASLFDTAFTERVPVADVQTLVDDYRSRLGALLAVTPDANGDQLRFASGALRATLELDAAGKAAGLRFHDEQSAADRTALVRLLGAEHSSGDWFTRGFLDQTALADVDAQNAQLRSTEGRFIRLDSRAGVYYAVFANAENIVQIATSTSGKIAYLSLGPALPKS